MKARFFYLTRLFNVVQKNSVRVCRRILCRYDGDLSVFGGRATGVCRSTWVANVQAASFV